MNENLSVIFTILLEIVMCNCCSMAGQFKLINHAFGVLLNEISLKYLPAGENPYKVDSEKIKQRAKLLQKYLKDEQKELQALYALQALMVQMEQPASKWLFFFNHRILSSSDTLVLFCCIILCELFL